MVSAAWAGKHCKYERLVPLLSRRVLPLSGFRNYGPALVVLFNFHSRVPGCFSWLVSTKATTNNFPHYSHVWNAVLEHHVDLDDHDRQMLQALLSISNQEDVCHPTVSCMVEPPLQDGQGWGGKGRIILIGDAAHAMRSTGQAGNVALEDSIVLCRALNKWSEKERNAAAVYPDEGVSLESRK